MKVGAFSAASNVTGVLTDTNQVSALMHRAGGLVFFDYATAAPYVKVRERRKKKVEKRRKKGSEEKKTKRKTVGKQWDEKRIESALMK